MRRPGTTTFIYFLIILSFGSCRVYKNRRVEINTEPAVHSKYYDWISLKNGTPVLPTIEQKFKTAMDSELRKKGFLRDTVHPGLLLEIQVINNKQEEYYPLPPTALPPGSGTIVEYYFSTATLRVFDAQSGLLWSCRMSGKIDHSRQEDRAARIGARDMVKKFPFNPSRSEQSDKKPLNKENL